MTSSSIFDPPVSLHSEHNEEAFPRSPNGALSPKEEEAQDAALPLSTRRQNLFMVFITLTQLVQMIPLGAGINSSLAIGKVLGATNVQSVWIVASYPLTQGSFVLIGTYSPHQLPPTTASRESFTRLRTRGFWQVVVWVPSMGTRMSLPSAVCGGFFGLCAVGTLPIWSQCAL